jgi:mannan endo-1,4-beta-mannosidase
MKKSKFLLIAGLFYVAAFQSIGQLLPNVDVIRNNLVDKQVTEKTAIMYFNMMENSRKGIMLGQHDAFTARQIDYPDPDMSDIKYTTGKNPLVGGLDFMFITDVQNTPGSWFEGQENQIKEQAVQNYYRGMITTFTWHFRNPYTKDWFSVSGIPERVAISNKSMTSILPGGENHDYYKSVLEKIASVFHELKDSTGTPIPFIFRPFHEFDGNWFWWGKPYCTADQFKENWRFTVHYLRDSLNVHNIIYAFSPDNHFKTTAEYLERYPGDDYVDLVGMDNYYDFESNNIDGAAQKLKIVSDFAKSRNKLAALTECGYRNTSKPNDLYTKKFLTALNKYPLELAYLMFWGNGQYTPVPGQNTAPDFINFVNDTLILAEGDVDDLYSFALEPLEYINGTALESNKKRLVLELSAEVQDLDEFFGFSVQLDQVDVGIDSVVYSTDEKRMFLYLTASITNNQEITISYHPGNVLSKDGIELSAFTNRPVENLLDGSAPMLKSAHTDLDGQFIYLTFNKKMLLNGFRVDSLKIHESNHVHSLLEKSSYSHFNEDSTILALAMVSKLYAEYNLTVSYHHNAFGSKDGGLLKEFTHFSVENQAPGFSPVLVSANVLPDGSGVKLEFNKSLDTHLSSADGFKVFVNGVEKSISGALILFKEITLTLAENITFGDEVTVTFGGNVLVSTDRGVLSEMEAFSVTNNLVETYKARFFDQVSVSANTPVFAIDTASVTSLMYVDRSYAFSDLPDYLKGAEYIVWQNNLKSHFAEVLLSFTLRESGNLFIAHDNRLAKPGWLSDKLVKSGLIIPVPDSEFSLYTGFFTKDQFVELGANQVQGAETGTSTHYIVFFVPDDTPLDVPSRIGEATRQASFEIFPNPCRNAFSISAGDFDYNRVEIYTVTGQLVFSKAVDSRVDNRISMTLKSGLYIVKIGNSERVISSLLSVY